jgi:flavin reductase (DIM6/NTAB) family NADH-FMN oxidoreductase RutF
MGSGVIVAVDSAVFKVAMRQLAATVTLVTTCEEGAWHGMPATAVTSLSVEPPSVLVCINRSASMHGPVTRSRKLCVNLLATQQADLCSDFGARPGAERFDVGAWQAGPDGLPYIAEAVACLFCTVDDALDYSTHTIFIAKVGHVLVDATIEPLVYRGGQMGGFRPLGSA